MPIQRTPHPIFAGLWATWSVYMIVSTFLPVSWLVDGILWVSWGAIEGTAVWLNTGFRETQSEIVTWLHRYMNKGPFARIPYRGWNALLFVPYIALMSFNIFQLFWGRGPYMEAFGFLLATSIGVGMWEHWVHPDRGG